MVTAFSNMFSENLQQIKGLHITFAQFDLRGSRSHASICVIVTIEKSLKI